jgi:nitric oxide reductase large subunit
MGCAKMTIILLIFFIGLFAFFSSLLCNLLSGHIYDKYIQSIDKMGFDEIKRKTIIDPLIITIIILSTFIALGLSTWMSINLRNNDKNDITLINNKLNEIDKKIDEIKNTNTGKNQPQIYIVPPIYPTPKIEEYK